MDWWDPDRARAWIVIVVAVAVLIALVGLAREFIRHKAQQRREPSRAQVQIAWISEDVSLTWVGIVCTLALLAHQLFCIITFADVKSAVQEASIGTIWIAGNVLFGLGVAVGRRRTYRVFRDDPKAD